MVKIYGQTKKHAAEAELADYLSDSLSAEDRERIESHIAGCPGCLERIVSAHESVKSFNEKKLFKIRKDDIVKKINLYLTMAIISFALSFVMPQYFLQLLVATLLLGAKWVVDSKTTRMLIMIQDAWKKGGEKEASQILRRFDFKK